MTSTRLEPGSTATLGGSLKVRPLAFNSFRENLVVLARESLVMRPERTRGSRRIEVTSANASILASTLIGEDDLVLPDEIGVPEPAMHRLGVKAGDVVHVAPARPPASLSAIGVKLSGGRLDETAFTAVARDLVAHRWSDMEVAALLVACASSMSPRETLALTRGMIAAGERLSWGGRNVVDKHCIGGIPGNRTSLIVAPIVAAHGLTIPKTSSRAITSPAGTADTMEVFARVDLTEAELRRVVQACGGCIAWGGRVNLSPADDVLVSVERPLGIDTAEQMVASILSKKVAAGVRHLVLDVPVGPSAKVRGREAAESLKSLFEFVASHLDLKIDVHFSDGSQPIGRGVGPVLEARDVMAVLKGAAEAPEDLKEKSIRLAGRLLETDKDVLSGQGEARARHLLASGAAARKFMEIAEAQGPSPLNKGLGTLTYEVPAKADGVVTAIDCLRIARIARLAGAPTDAGAGIDLCRKVGEPVRKGEPLYRIHGFDASDHAFAVEAAVEDPGVSLDAGI